ncbi:MAG: N-acetylmuramic acid 6-phosphate etherase [Saprospiraceae bacterium]|nr:N-acetylmuramic acid 6-phosphate etherase [Saprospiraceae bacterium]
MKKFLKITESESVHYDLEKKSISELLKAMNDEDQRLADCVKMCIPKIELLVHEIVIKLRQGGRLFYIGAGTSGRLGIIDASECPPTFGVPEDMVIAIIAGGDRAIRTAVEGAEDNTEQAWLDLQQVQVSEEDIVIGIASSGTTPYVVEGLKKCQENNIITGCITCNAESPITNYSNFPVVCLVGPEFITGSTRLKSGSVTKLILNMISTTTMIQLGRVLGNKMVDMKLSNQKLMERGIRQLCNNYNISTAVAKQLLLEYKSVREAMKVLERNPKETI